MTLIGEISSKDFTEGNRYKKEVGIRVVKEFLRFSARSRNGTGEIEKPIVRQVWSRNG